MADFFFVTGFPHESDVTAIVKELFEKVPTYWMDPEYPRIVIKTSETSFANLQEKVEKAHLPLFADSTQAPESVLVKTYGCITFGAMDKIGMLFTIKSRGGGRVEIVKASGPVHSPDCFEVKFKDGWDSVERAASRPWFVEDTLIDVVPYFRCFSENFDKQLKRLKLKKVSTGQRYPLSDIPPTPPSTPSRGKDTDTVRVHCSVFVLGSLLESLPLADNSDVRFEFDEENENLVINGEENIVGKLKTAVGELAAKMEDEDFSFLEDEVGIFKLPSHIKENSLLLETEEDGSIGLHIETKIGQKMTVGMFLNSLLTSVPSEVEEKEEEITSGKSTNEDRLQDGALGNSLLTSVPSEVEEKEEKITSGKSTNEDRLQDGALGNSAPSQPVRETRVDCDQALLDFVRTQQQEELKRLEKKHNIIIALESDSYSFKSSNATADKIREEIEELLDRIKENKLATETETSAHRPRESLSNVWRSEEKISFPKNKSDQERDDSCQTENLKYIGTLLVSAQGPNLFIHLHQGPPLNRPNTLLIDLKPESDVSDVEPTATSPNHVVFQMPPWESSPKHVEERFADQFYEVVCTYQIPTIVISTSKLMKDKSYFPAQVLARVVIGQLLAISKRLDPSTVLNIYINEYNCEAVFYAFTFYIEKYGLTCSKPKNKSWRPLNLDEKTYPDRSKRQKIPTVDVVDFVKHNWHRKDLVFLPIDAGTSFKDFACQEDWINHTGLHLFLCSEERYYPDGLKPGQVFEKSFDSYPHDVMLYGTQKWGLHVDKSLRDTFKNISKVDLTDYSTVYVVMPIFQAQQDAYPLDWLVQRVFEYLDQGLECFSNIQNFFIVVDDGSKKDFKAELRRYYPKQTKQGFFKNFIPKAKASWNNFMTDSGKNTDGANRSKHSDVGDNQDKEWPTLLTSAACRSQMNTDIPDTSNRNRKAASLVVNHETMSTWVPGVNDDENRISNVRDGNAANKDDTKSTRHLAELRDENGQDAEDHWRSTDEDMTDNDNDETSHAEIGEDNEPMEVESSSNDSSRFHWMYECKNDDGGRVFRKLDAHKCRALERSMDPAMAAATDSVDGDVIGDVDFSAMEATIDGRKRGIIAMENIDVDYAITLPPKLEPLKDEEYTLVRIYESMADFDKIKNKLEQSLKPLILDITKVEMIQNPFLYKRWVTKKSELGYEVRRCVMWHKVLAKEKRMVCRYGLHKRFSAMPRVPDVHPPEKRDLLLTKSPRLCLDSQDIREERDVLLVESFVWLILDPLDDAPTTTVLDSDALAFPNKFVSLSVRNE